MSERLRDDPSEWGLTAAEYTRRAVEKKRAREKARREQARAQRQHSPRRSEPIFVAVKRAAPARDDDWHRGIKVGPDTRDLTGRHFGDPLPGRSVLDLYRQRLKDDPA